MIAGVGVMIVGVLIAESIEVTHIVHYVTNTVGFGIHAVGTIPFIEYIGNLSIVEDVEAAEEVV